MCIVHRLFFIINLNAIEEFNLCTYLRYYILYLRYYDENVNFLPEGLQCMIILWRVFY